MLRSVQTDLAERRARADPGTAGDAAAKRRPRKRLCIVGGGSISQNPRVVKEADALTQAGYDVIVLFVQHFEWARALDRRFLEGVKWRSDIVEALPSVGGRQRRAASALQLLLFGQLCRWTMRFPAPELAYARYFLPLLRRAIRHRADLYIGHYAASLPVVACAAAWNGAKFAFDFEDFHRGEATPGAAARLIAGLEDRYLPAASLLTAASWGIAEEVANTTGLPAPATVLNVFPWADRARLPAQKPRPQDSALSLYWFSQIVGLDRGLQDAIGALALMRAPVELHIRGADANGSIEALRRHAQEGGVLERIHFHPPLAPAELLADAAIHDVGLCLEVPATRNRNVCVTNKVFVYMLAGLAIAASRTRGHMDVLNAAPDAGLCYDSGDAAALAAMLDRYAADRLLLAGAKAAALAAARERWNWERESKLVVAAVDRLFAQSCAEAIAPS